MQKLNISQQTTFQKTLKIVHSIDEKKPALGIKVQKREYAATRI